MNIRDLLTPEAEQAWRQKGIDKASDTLEELEKLDLSEAQRFHRLHTLYEALELPKEKCMRHFNANGDYAPKDYADLYNEVDEVAPTYGCYLKAVEMQKIYCRAMAPTTLARVNGTSAIFNDCAVKVGLDPQELISSMAHSEISLPVRIFAAYK